MAPMCLRCCPWNPRRHEDDDEEDNDSEDSEMYWIRQRREEQRRRKSMLRNEFLDNVLITKIVVLKDATVEETETSSVLSSEFVLEGGSDMSCAICLIDYEGGDLISFSHNPSCQHHFHRECIQSWLKKHDECPCCRKNYLAFSDDEEEGEDQNGARGGGRIIARRPEGMEDSSELITSTNADNPISLLRDDFEVPIDENHLYQEGSRSIVTGRLDRLYGSPEESRSIVTGRLDRLYETGVFERNEPYETRFSETASSPTAAVQIHDREREDRIERRLERVVEVLREQVGDHVQQARQQLREQRESRSQNGRNDDDRVERSIELVRGQMARVRDAARREIQNRRNRGGNNVSTSRHNQNSAVRVVRRTRLHDVANSEPVHGTRERSSRTVHNLVMQASSRRTRDPV